MALGPASLHVPRMLPCPSLVYPRTNTGGRSGGAAFFSSPPVATLATKMLRHPRRHRIPESSTEPETVASRDFSCAAGSPRERGVKSHTWAHASGCLMLCHVPYQRREGREVGAGVFSP